MHTGKIMREMRRKAGMTQQKLADLLGTTKSNVAQLEAAEHCSTRSLTTAAEKLGFTIIIGYAKNIQIND